MVDKPYSLEGQYRVVLEDPQQLDEYKIECRGREEDLGRYLNSDVHLVLKINESDLNRASLQFTRPLIYYLPGEFGQVEILNKKEVPISFRLEKIESK